MRILILTIYVFMMACVVSAQVPADLPTPSVIVQGWKQVYTITWQPQPHPYFHYHDHYYIDPSGESIVEITCYTLMCPAMGGRSVGFVYRMKKDRRLIFLQFDLAEDRWELLEGTVTEEMAQSWHDDFDEALKQNV